ncbi:hypothetical protein I79_026087 [Cricetulus griseus]|uniref:Uncharacterized protein n=1 Tax=Cricetulus griseus TaxID=10029 RepID=G3IQ02_CRIGR|nr:hypothetical protein I79_026087 [Cricetulus griseus]
MRNFPSPNSRGGAVPGAPGQRPAGCALAQRRRHTGVARLGVQRRFGGVSKEMRPGYSPRPAHTSGSSSTSSSASSSRLPPV